MSRKTCDFSQIFVRKMFCCASADINFALVFTVFFACRTLFFVSLFACILDPKNLPKTLPKWGSNPWKIDVKNVLFFNIDFFGFWPQVGGSWRPKMEASWLQIPSSSLLGCPLWRSYTKNLLKMASWRPPGSILGIPRVVFGGFWNHFCDFLDPLPVISCLPWTEAIIPEMPRSSKGLDG